MIPRGNQINFQSLNTLQEPESVQFREIQPHTQRIDNSFIIKGKMYRYNGPKTEETDELIEMLANMERDAQNFENSRIGKLQTSYNELAQKFLEKCTFFSGRVRININHVYIVIFYWSVYFSTVSESEKIKNSDIIAKDTIRQNIAANLPMFAFLYTFGSLICQQITNIFIWIVLFIFLLITPLFVLLDYHLNIFNTYDHHEYDYIGIGVCIVSFMILGHSIINRILLYYIQKIANSLVAVFINCSFCLLISYFIIFKIVSFIIILESTKIPYIINGIKEIIAAPMFFGLFILSTILIRGLFRITPKQIESDLQRLKLTLYAHEQVRNEMLNYGWGDKIANKLKKFKPRIVGPILVTICYATLELYCYGGLIHEMSQTYIDYQLIITFSVLLGAIPIFLMFGICIANSNFQIGSLYLWVPLLIGGASTFLTVKIWNLTYQNEYIQQISRLIGISPLIISFIWLSVGYFRSERRNQKMFVMVITCYFFAFPLGFLLTLSDAFEDFGMTISAFTLMGIGLIPLAIVALYYIVVAIFYLFKLKKQAETLNFLPYSYLDLSTYAHWVNSIGYVLGFYFLCHFVWNEPITATGTKKGTIQGLIVIHTLLFILTNKALKLYIYDRPPEEENLKLQYERYIARQKNMILAGSILPFVILLPASLTRDDESQKNAILACGVGIPVVFQYFKLQIFIRQESKFYQNFFQPLIVIIMWFFVIGPVGLLFPILADMFQNDSDEFKLFAQLGVAYTILISIICVTCASIFYSVLLNKELLEMKKREVLKSVMQELANHRVSSTEDICSLIFMRFIHQQDPSKLKEELKNGDIVNVIEYPGDKTTFDEMLVTKQNYDEKKKIEKQAKRRRATIFQQSMLDIKTAPSSIQQQAVDAEEAEQQKGICYKLSDYIFACVFCRYGTDELEQMAVIETQKETDLAEIDQWKEIQMRRGNRNQPDDNYMQQLQRDDFYISLKVSPQKVERFWVSIYKKFAHNFQTIVEYLDLIRDDDILSQYPSYDKIDRYCYRLSLADFAQFMRDNTPKNVEKPYDYLWQLAKIKYPMFLYNFPEIKTDLKLTQQDTPFSISDYNDSYFHGLLSNEKRLVYKEEEVEEYIEQQYQFKRQALLKKYAIKAPGPLRRRIWEMCKCMNEWLWIKPLQFTENLMNRITESLFTKLNQVMPQQEKIVKNLKWEILSQNVGDCLISQCSSFDKKMESQEYKFNVTSTNILAVLLRLNDLYGLVTLAFAQQVGWTDEKPKIQPEKIPDYSILEEYNLFFAFALIMSFTYIVLGIQASKEIEKNTFGYDNQGRVATFRSKSFWLSKIIQFLSGQFIFVMKTFIDSLICDYKSYPYTLVRKREVECMSDLHFMYVVLAIIGCGLFYPLSTFLQPSFQYSDHSLHLKYKSSYVVLYIQAKLLILGLSSVFSNLQQQAYLYQMLFSTIVMIILIYCYIKLWPSYVKWFNNVELCFLFLLSYCYFGAFLILLSNTKIAGIVFLALTASPTIGFFGYRIYQDYKLNNLIRNSQVVPRRETETSQILYN